MTAPLYEPAEAFLLRAPLLPLQAELDADRLLESPLVRTALRIGSPSLAEALDRPGPRTGRTGRSLLRYLVRLSTRPTPYGLFAGVALGRWGASTTLALEPERPTRTRPDMGWLLGRVLAWEQDREVRPHLRLQANPAVVLRAGRAFLGERTRFQDGRIEPVVSVRATRLLREVLARTRRPVAWSDLRDGLGGPPDRVETFLHELLDGTILLTDLRPPLTDPDPARWVLERLRSIPPLESQAQELAGLVEQARRWDALPVEAREEAFQGLPEPVQVDSALRLRGSELSEEVAREVARAAELLLRLTPFPRGLAYLREYRSRFVERYGLHRDVPLTELVDPVLGLAPPAGVSEEPQARRNQVLLDLAGRALARRQRVLELDDEVLALLAPSRPQPQLAPATMDLCALVAARDRESLDAGEFMIVVGPNLGSEEAGRNLGRFAGLLGAELDDLLEGLARIEESARPGTLRAEISYLPRKLRSANVAVRRGHASHEVALGVGTVAEAIPLDEVAVAVREGRFCLRWRGREVVPAAGHMLNDRHAAPPLQFLGRHRRDAGPQLHPFDWGPAWSLPFLPRVSSGRVVLQPARWRLAIADLPVASWRQEWDVPRHVHVGQGDVRLLLDLDDPRQAAELEGQVRKVREATVLEALPAPDGCWLPGPGGRYLAELVVPLLSTAPPRKPAPEASRVQAQARRAFPPGSEWTFLKLYAAPDAEDELVARPLRPLLDEEAFFVRYSDPEPHLRLRLRGGAESLQPLARLGEELLAGGLVQRVAFDTYEREIERYGGDEGMEACEALFVADSRFAADLLDRRFRGVERPLLGALAITWLLEALGLAEEVMASWRTTRRDCREAARTLHRERGRELLRLHSEPGDLETVFESHRGSLEVCGRHLREANLARPLVEMADDLVHMHVNRLLGRDRALERQVIGLAMRLGEARRARGRGAGASGGGTAHPPLS